MVVVCRLFISLVAEKVDERRRNLKMSFCVIC